MITGSFLTGSRAYGIPREHSDTDIVIRCDKDDAYMFHPKDYVDSYVEDGGVNSMSAKINNVNYILCFNDATYDAWSEGTDELRKIRPVTRLKAIEVIAKKFSMTRNNQNV